MSRLPDRPSELIRLALRDLRSAIASGYLVNMNDWHTPLLRREGGEFVVSRDERGRARCEVCLAGAVMACSLGAPRDRDMGPFEIALAAMGRTDDGSLTPSDRVEVRQHELYRKLRALDYFRIGFLWSALEELQIQVPRGLPGRVDVVRFQQWMNDDDVMSERGRAEFFASVEEVAATLESFGL